MPITKASDLFGKINVYPPQDGQQRVEIYIRLQQSIEGMEIGMAIDGSRSMIPNFAAQLPKAFRQPGSNVMEPTVRSLCRFACDYSGDGTILPIYWAVGAGGKEIEPIGRVSAAASETMPVEGPKSWGGNTFLLPALNFFLNEFNQAKWAVVLFTTDGVLEDLDAVIEKAMEVGSEILQGRRGSCKFIVVGYFHDGLKEKDIENIKNNLEKLDNMFDGTELQGKVDLWDCKEVEKMEELAEIWDEVDFGINIPGSIRIADQLGKEVYSKADEFPQRIEFTVPEGTPSVTLEIAGQTINQSLK
ncbi:MAG: hypothetical protein AAGK10_10025 [Cyanobacteria bacterium J06555_3]